MLRKANMGFTIIELIVVMFIITLLSTLVLANYRQGQWTYSLSRATQQMASDLRKAQNMAMSGVDIEGQYCGYGIEIYVNPRPYSYRFYADVVDDCSDSNHKYDGSDFVIETVNLPNGITIRSSSPSPLDIFFEPPEPTTYINQSDALGLFGIITLEVENFDLPAKTITVNTSGLVQIE